MNKVISTERVPIKIWANDIEDEALSVYKNIDTVMELQQDLVIPVVKLQPIAVIKG